MSAPQGPTPDEKRRLATMLATILFMVLALMFYFVLLGARGIDLLRSGSPAGILLGVGVIVLPVVGIWIVAATIRAGLEHQRLAGKATDAGMELDVSDLPKMPSGRIDRDAADELFTSLRQEYEADPGNWVRVYRLARAYDYAGDRSRARETMKQAVEMERKSRES